LKEKQRSNERKKKKNSSPNYSTADDLPLSLFWHRAPFTQNIFFEVPRLMTAAKVYVLHPVC
jgi:hypothetical protein